MAMDVQTFFNDFSPVTRRVSEVQMGAFFSADLNLQTLEGDRVRIAFNTGESLTQSRSETRVGTQLVSQEFSSVAIAASRYSITVAGDLNEDELQAIQHLVDAITPIAGDFFTHAKFDSENAESLLGINLGEIQSFKLSLEKTVVVTVTGFEQVRGFTDSSGSGLMGAEFPNLANIRGLPELIHAVLETVLSAGGRDILDNDEILNTLHDLMTFLRERFSIFGNPGQPPFVTQAETVAEPAVGFFSTTSAPPPEPEPAV